MALSKRQKDLQAELGKNYRFEKYISDAQVRKLEKSEQNNLEDIVIAELEMGCAMISASAYTDEGKVCLGYDIYVKSELDNEDWILFDTLDDKVIPKEHNMFCSLDNVVDENNLSYFCGNFETIQGKQVIPHDKKLEME